MANTDRSTVVSQYIKTLIDTNKAALNVSNVLYGDHNQIPPGVSVVVNDGVKNRTLQRVAYPGAGTRNKLNILITVYNNKTGDEATERLLVNQVAEDVEHLLHQNTLMGGNVLHGFVETWNPGHTFKIGSMFRSVQMIWVGDTKTNLTDIP